MTFFGNSLFASASRWRGVGELEKQMHFMLPGKGTKEHIEMFKEIKLAVLNF
jgi:hypothetical protein